VCGTELDDHGVKDVSAMLLQPDFSCPMRALSCDHFEVHEQTTSLSFAGKGAVSSPVLVMLCGVLKLNQTIRMLDLSGVDMDVEAARALQTALASNSTVTSLDVRDNPKLWVLKDSGVVNSDGLDAIASGLHANGSIEKARVDKLELSVRMLKGSDPNPALTFAGSTTISDVSAALVGKLVEHNKVAKSLDLSDLASSQCTRVGHAAGRCLASNTALTTVLLRNSHLRDDGINALADGLLQNTGNQVRVLDVASNGIGVGGAGKIAELLTASTVLQKLDLTTNKLGSKGTEMLIGGLGADSKLSALSLRDNDIDQTGARAVAAAMRGNSTIVTLWLGKNKFGDEGTIALVDALVAASKTSKLAHLDLHKNSITKAGIASLTAYVADSPSLIALGLAGTKLQFTETELMQANAKEKPEIGRSKPVRLWMGPDMKNWPDF